MYGKITSLIDMLSSPEEEQLVEFEKLSVEDMVMVLEVVEGKVIRGTVPSIFIKMILLRELR